MHFYFKIDNETSLADSLAYFDCFVILVHDLSLVLEPFPHELAYVRHLSVYSMDQSLSQSLANDSKARLQVKHS